MKKHLKYIAFALLIVTVCISLCSCKQLDAARSEHAWYSPTDDGFIYFRENTYKPLPECDDFSPVCEFNGYVTEHDVPVLVKEMYGDYFSYSEDLKFLNTYGTTYCVEDIYDEYCEKIKSYKLDNYCIEKMNYDEETHKMSYETVILSEKAKNALNDILNNSEPIDENISEYYSTSILLCDKIGEFQKYIARFVSSGNGLYITTEGKDYQSVTYKVDDKYEAILTPYLNFTY